ncbi:hypothetical protein O181_040837 [Austropuccinia psidii MF-1]|uniref:DDE Tnp4 domain-containing protein n=1 Tax=Austropuccinia psidii MF-1 TaxID=1389203 RepID=A0A9Q3DJN5_9BASI|nr:hypothetical protein [Austropuccinia psidii MF-1]
MSIQLVCNINKQFTALDVGCTGSLHDLNVYQHMKIAQKSQGFYEKDQYLVANSAYESSPWVVPAYKGVVAQNEDNRSFNYCLAKSRVRIKHAIGILKGWWFSLREMQNQMRDDHEIEYFDDDPPHAENLSNNNIGEDVVNMHEKIKPVTLAWKDSQL